MNLPGVGNVESLGVMFTLLPGLLTYLLVRSLTARERRVEAREAVLQGLAYTLLVHAMWTICASIGTWSPTPGLVGLSLCALALGVLVARLSNRGAIYQLLRKLGVTTESGWASIWESAFREFRTQRGEYGVFHLRDERRIMEAIRGNSLGTIGVRHHFRREAVSGTKDAMAGNGA